VLGDCQLVYRHGLTFQVSINSARGNTFRQSDDPSFDQPANEDGRPWNRVSGCNGLHGLMLSQYGTICAAQRRKGARKNFFLLQPGDELWLRTLDRELNLIVFSELMNREWIS
jgi:hypothetical protein